MLPMPMQACHLQVFVSKTPSCLTCGSAPQKRKDAILLTLMGQLIARRFCPFESHALVDVWIGCVLPLVVER